MSAKHTPGQWVVNAADPYEVLCCGVPVAYAESASTKSRDERSANAHLIAAAPELRKMLCDLRAEIEVVRDSLGQIGAYAEVDRYTALLARIDALLDRADGRVSA